MALVVSRSVEGGDEQRRYRGVVTCGCCSKRMKQRHAEPQGATAAALSAPFHPCVLVWASVNATFKAVFANASPSVLAWPAHLLLAPCSRSEYACTSVCALLPPSGHVLACPLLFLFLSRDMLFWLSGTTTR